MILLSKNTIHSCSLVRCFPWVCNNSWFQTDVTVDQLNETTRCHQTFRLSVPSLGQISNISKSDIFLLCKLASELYKTVQSWQVPPKMPCFRLGEQDLNGEEKNLWVLRNEHDVKSLIMRFYGMLMITRSVITIRVATVSNYSSFSWAHVNH